MGATQRASTATRARSDQTSVPGDISTIVTFCFPPPTVARRLARHVVGARRRPYISSGNSRSSAMEKTGPSTQTYRGPMLQRPQMPMPHFILFSRVV